MQCVGHSLRGSSQEQTDHKRAADLLQKSVLHPRSAVSGLGTSFDHSMPCGLDGVPGIVGTGMTSSKWSCESHLARPKFKSHEIVIYSECP